MSSIREMQNLEMCLENESMPHFSDLEEECLSNSEIYIEKDGEGNNTEKGYNVKKSDNRVQLLQLELETERLNHGETSRVLEQLILDHEELLLKYATAENTIDRWRFSRMASQDGAIADKPPPTATSTFVEFHEFTQPKPSNITNTLYTANCFNQPDDEIQAGDHRKIHDVDNSNIENKDCPDECLTEEIFTKRAASLEDKIVKMAEEVSACTDNDPQYLESKLQRLKTVLEEIKHEADNVKLVYESPWDVVGKVAAIEEAYGHLAEIVDNIRSRDTCSQLAARFVGNFKTGGRDAPPFASSPVWKSMSYTQKKFMHESYTVHARLESCRQEDNLGKAAQDTEDFARRFDQSDLFRREYQHRGRRNMRRDDYRNIDGAVSKTESSREVKITTTSSRAHSIGRENSMTPTKPEIAHLMPRKIPRDNAKKPTQYLEEGIISFLNKLIRKSVRTEKHSEKLLRQL